MLKELIKEILKEELADGVQDMPGQLPTPTPPESGSLMRGYVGKYVIVRSRNDGVNAGYLVAADETGVVLKEARRLWYHKPVEGAWYEGVSQTGLDKRAKTATRATKIIVEDYSITLCTDAARMSIEAAPDHLGGDDDD